MDESFDHIVNSASDDNIYEIMNAKINDTKLKYDYIAKSIIEGCIFLNPPQLTGIIGQINGQVAQLCSVKKNKGYNDGQKLSVHVKNISSDQINIENTDNVHIIDNIDNIDNEKNIKTWCYKTNEKDFCLLGNTGLELFDLIDNAVIIVSHNDGDSKSISIECVEIQHRLEKYSLLELENMIKNAAFDYRSSDNSKYCVHKDFITNFYPF